MKIVAGQARTRTRWLGIKERNLVKNFWKRFASFSSLFLSLGTLLCCALPALLVALGFGAVVAGVTSQIPQLIWLSEHKDYLFILAFVALAIATVAALKSREVVCVGDAAAAEACHTIKSGLIPVIAISWLILVIGFFFAYLAPWFLI